MDKDQLKKLILEYLSRNKLMSLATSFKDTPWAATVFFNFDQGLNIYFISRPQRRHSLEILKNPIVAITINQDFGTPGKIRGLQVQGMAKVSEDKKELDDFVRRHPWATRFLDSHKLFKITPTFMRYLDDERFGPGGNEELILS